MIKQTKLLLSFMPKSITTNDNNGLGMRAHNYKLNIETHLDMKGIMKHKNNFCFVTNEGLKEWY